MLSMYREDKNEITNIKSRTLKHDSAIVKFNMLARYFRKEGKKAIWRDELGESRKTIGDFTCYIALFYGLNAR